MPTSDYGGQGAPSYNKGEFTVEYSLNTTRWGRRERRKVFAEYDKAKAFYDSIDDSAAIWDTTRYAELCEAKSRIAYYCGVLESRKSAADTLTVHTVASELDGAAMMFGRNLRGSGWKLRVDSVKELTEEEYNLLDPAADIQLVIPKKQR